MNRPWVGRLPIAEAERAAALRTTPHVTASEHGSWLWLRGYELDDDLTRALRRVPGLERFHVSADGLIIPVGRRVPVARLPTVDWKPLRELIALAPAVPRLAADLRDRVRVTLVRSSREEPPAGLLADIGFLAAWAEEAPWLRLRPLTFACSRDGRCLVRGLPLPPIPGTACVESHGVAWPAGWRCEPDVGGAVLARLFGVEPGGAILLDPDGSHEVIAPEEFIPLTRRAARTTRRNLRMPAP